MPEIIRSWYFVLHSYPVFTLISLSIRDMKAVVHLIAIWENSALVQQTGCELYSYDMCCKFLQRSKNSQRLYIQTWLHHTWHNCHTLNIKLQLGVRYQRMAIYLSYWEPLHRLWELLYTTAIDTTALFVYAAKFLNGNLISSDRLYFKLNGSEANNIKYLRGIWQILWYGIYK